MDGQKGFAAILNRTIARIKLRIPMHFSDGKRFQPDSRIHQQYYNLFAVKNERAEKMKERKKPLLHTMYDSTKLKPD